MSKKSNRLVKVFEELCVKLVKRFCLLQFQLFWFWFLKTFLHRLKWLLLLVVEISDLLISDIHPDLAYIRLQLILKSALLAELGQNLNILCRRHGV